MLTTDGDTSGREGLCVQHATGPSTLRIIRSVKMCVAMLMRTKTSAPPSQM